MAERKRPSPSRESWVDRQIREAQERGEFDNLPGAGKPIPDIDRPRDDLWWVKNLMRRENLSITPPVLGLRKEREDARERALGARSEAEARRIVIEVNDKIRDLNAKATSGPPSNVVLLDVEEVVRAWRQRAH